MASQQSEVFICNLALGYLGERPIMSLNDPTTAAQLCKTNYPAARDASLEDAEWSFGMRVFRLPEADPPPAEDPRPPYVGRCYLKPGELLRPTRYDDGSGNWRLAGYVYGRYFIVEDGPEVLHVDAVQRVTDTTRFSPSFVKAVAAHLAADIAMPLTESQRREQQMLARYERYKMNAEVNDGRVGTTQRMRSDRLRRARR